MSRSRWGRRLCRPFLLAALLLSLTIGARTQETASGDFDAAVMAWDRGDYPAALSGFISVLKSPDAAKYLEPIALHTGELYETTELTSDGSAPRFSLDGRHIAFEVGQAPTRVSRVVASDDPHKVVAELPGTGAVFSPAGDRVAYLKLPADRAMQDALAAADKAQGQARAQAVQALAWLQATRSAIVVRDLTTGKETEHASTGLLKSTLTFASDGQTLYFVGASESDLARTDIYALKDGGQPVRVTQDAGHRTTPVLRGRTMLLALPNTGPFRQPAPAAEPGAPGAATTAGRGGRGGAGAPGGGPGGGRGGGAPSFFGLLHLESGRLDRIEGTAPALSHDGTQIAFVRRSPTETTLHVVAVDDASRPAVLKTPDRVDAPSFSPDGQRLVYQRMVKDDWEVFTAARDGKDERRLTREIQHDIVPHFLTNSLVIAAMGEPRHRRSYLYDATTGQRTRLFHNNTVRTIAPEYTWIPNAGGSRVLIVAERDGNTVSPDRGIYLVDLTRTVAMSSVLARLERSLAAEQALRENGQRMFKPLADAVRPVLNRVSTGRIYEYQRALFDFGSKHISQPGNAKAIDYLHKTYSSFGYQAEQQWFEPRGALGGKSANVLATLRGTEDPDLIYVVSSHFDSVAGGPGADDDSSGTAALLEAARVMAKTPMPATIVFASFTGEEAGLLGSREWVRRAQEGKLRVIGALNNDMIGWANDHRLDNTIRYSNPGIRDVQHAAAFLFTRLITYDALYYKGTDANAYYDAWGDIVGGIGSYPVLGNPHYHQSHDLLETMNHELITETSKTTVATLMLLASSPSRIKDLTVATYAPATQTADLTWTPSPEKSVRSYTVAWGPAGQPLKQRMTVKEPHVTLKGVAPGTMISIKAVNARGLEGWDWARVTVAIPASQ